MEFLAIINAINVAAGSMFLNSRRNNDNDLIWMMAGERLMVNEKFKKDIEKYFKEQLRQIQYQITPDFFQIEPFYNEETLNLINLITEKEKYEGILFKDVKKIVLENAKKNKLVKHLNIILAGPSGTGKSTLINKILNLKGEKEIKTAIGVPFTMGEPKYYESDTVPFL